MKLHATCRFAPCSQTDRLIVRHGLETLHKGRLYRESFAPHAFMNTSAPATFQLSHDGPTVGHIVAVTASDRWFYAGFVVDTEDAELQALARERVKRGARVSPGFRSLRRDQDDDLCLIRHGLAILEEISLVDPGAVAGYIGAVVTDVHEIQPEPATLERAEEIVHDGRPLVRRFDSAILGVR